MTREEIEQAAAQEKRERADLCMKELQAVLEKYQCELIAVPQFAQGADGWRVVTTTQLVAK